jgi:hypothetical protein
LAGGTRSIAVVGTAKNVGKTVTFNALRAAALRRGIVGGAMSIGRDGEPGDALDGLPKPRVRLEAGSVVALPRGLVPRSPALEIVDVGERSALGPIVFARVHATTWCEIGGPPTARGVRATIDRLAALTAGPVFIDGALDRISPLAGGGDAIVLATGAASGSSVAAVARIAAETAARLALPAFDPARDPARTIAIDDALDARDAEALLAGERGATILVDDPTRIAIRGGLFRALCAAFAVRCRYPLRLVACTTSSAGPGVSLDPRALVTAVARATGIPAYDVVAGFAAA